MKRFWKLIRHNAGIYVNHITMNELLTFRELTLYLFLNNVLTLEEVVKKRIEYKLTIINSICKN